MLQIRTGRKKNKANGRNSETETLKTNQENVHIDAR